MASTYVPGATKSAPRFTAAAARGEERDSISVAVVSDYTLIASGILELLQNEPRFEAIGVLSLEECWAPLSHQEPDVVVAVLDQAGLRLEGFVQTLRSLLPRSKVVFLSLTDSALSLLAALRCGVDGALDLRADDAFLARCICEVMRGEIVIPENVTRELVREHSSKRGVADPAGKIGALTGREASILRLVARGESNKTIARDLSISENTVRAHVRSIIRKLEVSNRVQAAVVALQSGLAAP